MHTSVLDSFFSEGVMSVHLRQYMKPQVKRGKPGTWVLEELAEKEALTADAMSTLLGSIYREIEAREDAFIEKQRTHSTVMQLGEYRIVVTLAPLSNISEITVIRPIVRLHLEDYHMSASLRERLETRAEGILIAGSPGNGKSTFAEALLELYYAQSKIIKTIEVPRDLRAPQGVTQYSLSHSSLDEIRDLLLLTRPDFTFFDEVRNPEDIYLFKDLRLTGIGMVGVIHAHRAIDALQRLIGKIDLGMITQIVDTIIFIEAGSVATVYDLSYEVRVPSGMQDADLARPVIVVRDAESSKEVYEIYTFSDEVVVMPLDEEASGKQKVPTLVAMGVEEAKRRIRSRVDVSFDLEALTAQSVRIFLYKTDIPKFIGKGGANIQELEAYLGLHIDVMEKTTAAAAKKTSKVKEIAYRIEQDKKGRVILVPLENVQHALLYVDERRSFPLRANREGVFSIEKGLQTSVVQRGNFQLLRS